MTEGDLIGIPNVGAYGITASLLGFLSHPPPLEIAHENGQEREIWRLRYGHERHSSSISPPMSENEDRLLALLRPFLRLLTAGEPLTMSADLGKLGLDSLQSIELLMELEQAFGVTIPDEKITVESFATPANVLALLE